MIQYLIQTSVHKFFVFSSILKFSLKLLWRAVTHDLSKYSKFERDDYARELPKLRWMTYGSEEYRASLERLGSAVQHHYQMNRHHPEHFGKGVRDFDLLDLVEMWFDWNAAARRHLDGDILGSIEKNRSRFGYSDDIAMILRNSVK